MKNKLKISRYTLVNITDVILIGMPKASHLAMNYKQMRYGLFVGSPNPTGDRGLRVNFEKLSV